MLCGKKILIIIPLKWMVCIILLIEIEVWIKFSWRGKLEGGIYDLSLAEQYGPIDKEAAGYRQAAKYYLTASAFWKVDWPKAADYFSQGVCQYAPICGMAPIGLPWNVIVCQPLDMGIN